MAKSFRKTIMYMSKLKNIYNKTRSNEYWENYKKQKGFCVNLLPKVKQDCFRKLNMKNLTGNRNF